MNKYIFLATIQSTGTWWAINALKNHPEIGGASHVQTLMNFQNGWVLRDGWTGNPHNDHLAPEGKTTLIYSHYGGTPANFARWKPQNNYEFMMLVTPTLAPLRDPLICMIRAWHREPPLYPYDFLMDGWIHVAKRADTLGVKYWRMEPFDQEGFLKAVSDIGLSCPPDWVASLTPNVRINNTPGELGLHRNYENGNIAAIEKKLPVPWRRLKENEPVLRPFLEKRGFKNLLWWS